MVERAAPRGRREDPKREDPKREAPQEDRPAREMPKFDIDEYQALLQFDRDALDEALVSMADLSFRVGDAYVLAVSYRDGLKLDLERAGAEIDGQLRKKHEASESKYTEKSILSEIEMAPKIMTMKDRLSDATLRAARLGALKEAYQQRNRAIGECCDLYATNYFDTRAAAGYRNDAVDRKADINRRELGERRRSRD